MDVSEKNELEGQRLLDTIATLTGLPTTLAHEELNTILESTGQNSGEVTLESLRAAMLEYLQTLNDDMEAGSSNSTQ
ncbi:MAG TPA: hypothetical protein DCS07_01395 [Bdellovibrionales bacterium]|nr:MAG: hypothetical protein A2Z97_14660 [Bdellovibrionales bacterium GWB1_52_6]OFZ02588.1 MAG: hypothetical protein A2X97_07995 [Bdellovibrionales bacterium GWA1_52_35]OFZ40514.1 MAG: hypothetical protein A2070_09140 [Bdellovibrionales bacterium GWC1_52_8]HAR41279.1 hypothetical protein [Bdellovibrionales bacterium]HCM41440.1 hypothetical protein [Bdellovibrionales bacterium]